MEDEHTQTNADPPNRGDLSELSGNSLAASRNILPRWVWGLNAGEPRPVWLGLSTV